MISETEWFGDDMYETWKHSTPLSCSVPQFGDTIQCGKGVAMLNPFFAHAWKNSEGTWSAISSRIVSVHLHDSNKLNIAIVSVYALGTF